MPTDQAVLRKLRALVKVYKTQAQVAAYLNVSPSYITDILQGQRQPGPELLKRLGLEKRVSYRAVPPEQP